MKVDLKKGDMRRVWLLLGAVDQLDHATLKNLVELTGIPKATVSDVLNKVMNGEIPGLTLVKKEAAYGIEDWGQIINKKGIKKFFKDQSRSIKQ